MKIKIISQKDNPLLKRKEVIFEVNHTDTGATPQRLEVRKAVAEALKTDTDLVYIRKVETKTGTRIAVGTANIYYSPKQAKLVEPEYIIKRNMPPKKPEEEKKVEEKPEMKAEEKTEEKEDEKNE
ncbi:30S ribosomal protein S24e [Candidatus Bathyarchaeota archaeon]|nr:30S ribosomal protein S24e [Candidatus Bathyarchaeota archaeon]RJS80607.1 MAG: 30S ribosomal protein S24e [Candidatus Bathyarchaeota archaeon]